MEKRQVMYARLTTEQKEYLKNVKKRLSAMIGAPINNTQFVIMMANNMNKQILEKGNNIVITSKIINEK